MTHHLKPVFGPRSRAAALLITVSLAGCAMTATTTPGARASLSLESVAPAAAPLVVVGTTVGELNLRSGRAEAAPPARSRAPGVFVR